MLSPRNNRVGKRLREPFGKAGLTVAVVALVFAMLGGAYAATKLNGTQKKEVEKIAKKFQGTGSAGPAGSAGAKGDSGAKGDKGDTGNAGSAGAPGTGAEAISFAGAKGGCTEGGTEVKSAKPTTFVCNGVKGTTGFTKTLPSGETETGVWGSAFANLSGAGAEEFVIPISFSIPLPAPGNAFFFSVAQIEGNEFGKDEETSNGCIVGAAKCVDTGCRGTIAKPTAPKGVLCVYAAHEENEEIQLHTNPFAFKEESGYQTSGTLLRFGILSGSNRVDMNGAWAVTAP